MDLGIQREDLIDSGVKEKRNIDSLKAVTGQKKVGLSFSFFGLPFFLGRGEYLLNLFASQVAKGVACGSARRYHRTVMIAWM